MKHKLIAAVLVLSGIMCTTAYTKGFNFGEYNGDAKKGCVAVYDMSNELARLIPTSLAKTDYGIVTEDLKLTEGTYSNLKLYIPDDNIYLGEGKPVDEDVNEYFKEYPDIYEKDVYAYTAPAMVKSIKTDYVDDEIVWRVTLLVRGGEYELMFDDTCTVKTASEVLQDTVGKTVSCLKAGDVITVNYPFKDKRNDISLLFRPTKTDPLKNIDSESGFYPLYSYEWLTGGMWPMANEKSIGYYFGIVETVKDRYITLLTGNGSRNNAVDITIKDDTSTYSFDVSDSKSADITFASGIYPSVFTDEEFDSNGNIIVTADSIPKCYALVRTLDSVAVDIMFFDGFK